MAAPPQPPPPFGVLFPDTAAGFPIPSSTFTPSGPAHWTLDVGAALGPAAATAARDVVLFLTGPGALAPDAAVGLYVATAGCGGWEYRGCVHGGCPSAVLPLSWPGAVGDAAARAAVGGGAFAGVATTPPPGAAPGTALVGVSLEPLADALAKQGERRASAADWGRLVGRDAFRYLESFASAGAAAGVRTPDGQPALLIPAAAIDRWYARFEERTRADPDWLTRRREG